ncbi:hypothetical protein ACOMHN_016583 [Nucella lapillus]
MSETVRTSSTFGSIPVGTSVTEKRTVITTSSSGEDHENEIDSPTGTGGDFYYRSVIGPRNTSAQRTSTSSMGPFFPGAGRISRTVEISSGYGSPALINLSNVGAVAGFKTSREREKQDMRDLNERFANYIEKVRFLEAQNRKLASELDALRSKWGKETNAVKTMYETELEQARKVIEETNKDRSRLQVRVGQLEEQLDDFQRQLDDAKKWRSQDRETINKLNQQISELEAEIRMLRRTNDSLDTERQRDKQAINRLNEELEKLRLDLSNETIQRLDAENRAQTLAEELEFLKSVHEQELKELAALAYRDTTAENREFWKNELSQAIRDIQNEYDSKMDAIRGEMETFYNLKVQEFRTGATKQNMEVTHSREETKKVHKMLNDSKIRMADLEARNAHLEKQYQELLREMELKEQDHVMELNQLKDEMNKLRSEMESMLVELQTLMDAKLSLELEIAAYRKLLETEESRIGLAPRRQPRSDIKPEVPVSSPEVAQATSASDKEKTSENPANCNPDKSKDTVSTAESGKGGENEGGVENEGGGEPDEIDRNQIRNFVDSILVSVKEGIQVGNKGKQEASSEGLAEGNKNIPFQEKEETNGKDMNLPVPETEGTKERNDIPVAKTEETKETGRTGKDIPTPEKHETKDASRKDKGIPVPETEEIKETSRKDADVLILETQKPEETSRTDKDIPTPERQKPEETSRTDKDIPGPEKEETEETSRKGKDIPGPEKEKTKETDRKEHILNEEEIIGKDAAEILQCDEKSFSEGQTEKNLVSVSEINEESKRATAGDSPQERNTTTGQEAEKQGTEFIHRQNSEKVKAGQGRDSTVSSVDDKRGEGGGVAEDVGNACSQELDKMHTRVEHKVATLTTNVQSSKEVTDSRSEDFLEASKTQLASREDNHQQSVEPKDHDVPLKKEAEKQTAETRQVSEPTAELSPTGRSGILQDENEGNQPTESKQTSQLEKESGNQKIQKEKELRLSEISGTEKRDLDTRQAVVSQLKPASVEVADPRKLNLRESNVEQTSENLLQKEETKQNNATVEKNITDEKPELYKDDLSADSTEKVNKILEISALVQMNTTEAVKNGISCAAVKTENAGTNEVAKENLTEFSSEKFKDSNRMTEGQTLKTADEDKETTKTNKEEPETNIAKSENICKPVTVIEKEMGTDAKEKGVTSATKVHENSEKKEQKTAAVSIETQKDEAERKSEIDDDNTKESTFPTEKENGRESESHRILHVEKDSSTDDRKTTAEKASGHHTEVQSKEAGTKEKIAEGILEGTDKDKRVDKEHIENIEATHTVKETENVGTEVKVNASSNKTGEYDDELDNETKKTDAETEKAHDEGKEEIAIPRFVSRESWTQERLKEKEVKELMEKEMQETKDKGQELKEKEEQELKEKEGQELKEDQDLKEKKEQELKEKEVHELKEKEVHELKEKNVQEIKETEMQKIEEKEVPELKEKEVQRMKENEVQVLKEKEVQRMKEREVQEVKEREAQEVKEREAKEREVQKVKEKVGQELKEKDEEEKKEKEVQELKEKEVQELKEKDEPGKKEKVQELKGKDVQEVKEKDVQEVKEKDVQEVKEKDVQEVKEKDVQEVKEKDVQEVKEKGQEVKEKDVQEVKEKGQEVKEKDVQEVKEKDVQEVKEKDVQEVKVKGQEVKEKDVQEVKEKDVQEVKEKGQEVKEKDVQEVKEKGQEVKENDVQEVKVKGQEVKEKDVQEVKEKGQEVKEKDVQEKGQEVKEKDVQEVKEKDGQEVKEKGQEVKEKDVQEVKEKDGREVKEKGQEGKEKGQEVKEKGQEVKEKGQEVKEKDGQEVKEKDGQEVKEKGQEVKEKDGQEVKEKGQEVKEKDVQEVKEKDGQEVKENDGQEVKEKGQEVKEKDVQEVKEKDVQEVKGKEVLELKEEEVHELKKKDEQESKDFNSSHRKETNTEDNRETALDTQSSRDKTTDQLNRDSKDYTENTQTPTDTKLDPRQLEECGLYLQEHILGKERDLQTGDEREPDDEAIVAVVKAIKTVSKEVLDNKTQSQSKQTSKETTEISSTANGLSTKIAENHADKTVPTTETGKEVSKTAADEKSPTKTEDNVKIIDRIEEYDKTQRRDIRELAKEEETGELNSAVQVNGHEEKVEKVDESKTYTEIDDNATKTNALETYGTSTNGNQLADKTGDKIQEKHEEESDGQQETRNITYQNKPQDQENRKDPELKETKPSESHRDMSKRGAENLTNHQKEPTQTKEEDEIKEGNLVKEDKHDTRKEDEIKEGNLVKEDKHDTRKEDETQKPKPVQESEEMEDRKFETVISHEQSVAKQATETTRTGPEDSEKRNGNNKTKENGNEVKNAPSEIVDRYTDDARAMEHSEVNLSGDFNSNQKTDKKTKAGGGMEERVMEIGGSVTPRAQFQDVKEVVEEIIQPTIVTKRQSYSQELHKQQGVKEKDLCTKTESENRNSEDNKDGTTQPNAEAAQAITDNRGEVRQAFGNPTTKTSEGASEGPQTSYEKPEFSKELSKFQGKFDDKVTAGEVNTSTEDDIVDTRFDFKQYESGQKAETTSLNSKTQATCRDTTQKQPRLLTTVQSTQPPQAKMTGDDLKTANGAHAQEVKKIKDSAEVTAKPAAQTGVGLRSVVEQTLGVRSSGSARLSDMINVSQSEYEGSDSSMQMKMMRGEVSAKTTYQRTANGPVSIAETNAEGKFILLENNPSSGLRKEVNLAGWTLRRVIDNKRTITYKFPVGAVIKYGKTLKIWAGAYGSEQHGSDLVYTDRDSWETGGQVVTTLLNDKQEEKASHIQKTLYS